MIICGSVYVAFIAFISVLYVIIKHWKTEGTEGGTTAEFIMIIILPFVILPFILLIITYFLCSNGYKKTAYIPLFFTLLITFPLILLSEYKNWFVDRFSGLFLIILLLISVFYDMNKENL
jgi:hypothetical protein